MSELSASTKRQRRHRENERANLIERLRAAKPVLVTVAVFSIELDFTQNLLRDHPAVRLINEEEEIPDFFTGQPLVLRYQLDKSWISNSLKAEWEKNKRIPTMVVLFAEIMKCVLYIY